jgi:O-antigen/teichoic acid export membrane protein
MNLAYRIALNVFAGAAGKVAMALLGLLILGMLTRSLGPTDFGYYRTVLTYIAIVGIFSNFGTNTIALREMSKDDARQKSVISNAITMRIVLTLIILLISAAVAPLFDFDPIVLKGIFIALFGWLAYLTNEVIVAVFYNKLKQHLASAAEVIGTAFTCALVFLAVTLDFGMLAMLAALVSGQILTVLIAGYFANQLVPIRLQFDWSYWSHLLKVGWPIGASVILSVVTHSGDTMLLAILEPAEIVGYYGVGMKLFEIFISIPPLFASLMMPLLVQSVAQAEKFRFYANASMNVMMLAGLFVGCVLFKFSSEITEFIAGDQYEQTGIVIQILAPVIFFSFINSLFRIALTSIGKQKAMLKADIAGFLVAVPAFLILIPMWSYEGAAWAKALAYIAMLTVSSTVMLREKRINIIPSNIFKIALTGLATFGAFTVLDQIGVYWILTIFLGGILYLCVALLLGIIPVKLIPVPAKIKSWLGR